ncbi:ABC transporter substrate-binding protein [Lonsdalea quercina]|uniref:ABC transporter substrate-binding protein n=1 Tax=Lonsdalea quercina TaxID=71657 RepID=UPI003976F8D1
MMKSNGVTLRVLGTSVTLLELLQKQAEQDLGMNIDYRVCSVKEAQRIAVMHPESYDLYDQWFHNIDFVWPAQAIQPLEIAKLQYWDEINDLPKRGRLLPGQALSRGSEPSHRLYVQDNGELGANPTDKISMLPLTHNTDSFAYQVERLPASLVGKEESWGWLVDPAFFGQVALQDEASMGVLDAVLAVQARGLFKFGNVGNLTLEEIDRLADVLAGLRRQGHFAALGSTHDEASKLIGNQLVCIQSLWAPTYFRHHFRQKGFKLAVPREGYRAWYGGLSMSRCVSGRVKEAAYDYLNWWQSGWPGAVMARQGYYISNPQRTRTYLSDAEWDFWYGGKPAVETLPDAHGNPLIMPGELRDGGSYEQRMGHIAVWNSVMDEHNYLVRRWQDFVHA